MFDNNNTFDTIIDQIKMENNRLQIQLDTALQQNKVDKREIRDLNKVIKEFKRAVKMKKKSKKNNKNNEKEENKELVLVRHDNKSLKVRIVLLEEKIQTCDTTSSMLNKQIENFKKELKNKQNTIDNNKSILANLQKNCQEMVNKLQTDLNAKIKQLKAVNQMLNQKLFNAKGSFDDNLKINNDIIWNHRIITDAFNKRIGLMAKEISQHCTTIKDQAKIIKKKEREIKYQQASVTKWRDKHGELLLEYHNLEAGLNGNNNNIVKNKKDNNKNNVSNNNKKNDLSNQKSTKGNKRRRANIKENQQQQSSPPKKRQRQQ